MPLLLLFPLLLTSEASANGQSSHLWITLHALEHLPEGELRALLSDPAVRPMLLNGTMFPDGGYAVGDDYGEIAHWEPLQGAYRAWIQDRYEPPYEDAGAEHVAFLMGLGSHGIADQLFDSLYMERAKQHDAESDWAGLSMDTATDVAYMAEVGPVDYPDHWLPAEALVEVFGEGMGYTIDADTMERAQALLRVAVAYVASTSQIPEEVERYRAQFPWATAHQGDPAVPGSPPCEGEILARYWESLWLRLQGDLVAGSRILATFPADGAYDHERDRARVEARVSLVFSQAIDASTVHDGTLRIEGPDGQAVPAAVWLFYGDNSHVLHAAPQVDLQEDAVYTVTLQEPPATIDGMEVAAAGFAFSFSTGPAPEPADPPPPEAGEPSGGCSALGGSSGGAAGVGAVIGLVQVVGRRWRRRKERERSQASAAVRSS